MASLPSTLVAGAYCERCGSVHRVPVDVVGQLPSAPGSVVFSVRVSPAQRVWLRLFAESHHGPFEWRSS